VAVAKLAVSCCKALLKMNGAQMAPELGEDQQALLERVMKSLRKSEKTSLELSNKNTLLLLTGLLTSTAATLVAGITVAAGPIIGEGVGGWKLACAVAAVLAFSSTVSIGLGQQLRIAERLSTTNQCRGRLNSLKVIISTTNHSLEEVANEYAQIALSFPELVE
jgi:hypothetical protein